MKFVKSDTIKIKILEALSNEKKEHTYYSLTKKIKVSFSTLKPNCEFLETLGFIFIDRKDTESGRYNFLKITEEGREALKKIRRKR